MTMIFDQRIVAMIVVMMRRLEFTFLFLYDDINDVRAFIILYACVKNRTIAQQKRNNKKHIYLSFILFYFIFQDVITLRWWLLRRFKYIVFTI